MKKLLRKNIWSVATFLLFLLNIAFLYFFPALSESRSSLTSINAKIIDGKVMQVKDGDTVVISPATGGEFFVCRLYGIDSPETGKRGGAGQPYGEEALRELKGLVLGQNVQVVLTGQKTYNREVCLIEKDGLDINLEMVKRGYAWAYKQYLKRPHASEYIEAESKARRQKLGLWQDNNPTPPWEWRKINKAR